MPKAQSSFELLRTKNILAILDGDVVFGEISTSSVYGEGF